MNPEYTAPDRHLRPWKNSRLLTRLADSFQPAVRRFLESDDPKRRVMKNLLHGTFIGHALHPLLTDIPIGAWTVTAVCDALGMAGAQRFDEPADVALTVGVVGAAAAGITGLADWSDTTEEPQRIGMLHALVNGTALISYLTSSIARRRGARTTGRLTGFAGYGLMTLGAYLGGELSFDMQLGVKHTAVPVQPPREFVEVPGTAALREGDMTTVALDGVPLLATRFGDRVNVVSGVCTHRGAALAEGAQDGRCVRCPWHGSRFSLEDGRVVEGPATFGLAAYETQSTDASVAVRMRR